jgi:hypothetical protein
MLLDYVPLGSNYNSQIHGCDGYEDESIPCDACKKDAYLGRK